MVVDRPETLVKNRLADMRAQKGWSQATLAERLEVSRQTVNAIERQYDPSLTLAFKIAKVFDSRIEDLFIAE